MNALVPWLAPDVLRTLGLALVHFLWQGAALAALAAAAMAASRTASARYLAAVGSLALMLAAPVVTFFALRGPAETAARTAAPAAAHPLQFADHVGRSLAYAPAPQAPVANLLDWFVVLWFAGVLLFSLRTAGGFFLVARLRRRDAKPVEARLWALGRELELRLGIRRAVRYCESLHLDAPAVLGWFRPVVFLPACALTGLSEAQLRAVMAHELAHIRRLDSFVNLGQVAVETLLFYHPAVWWLSKRIRAERENCCDDVALAVCGDPAVYARALTLLEEARVAPSLAMAANSGPLLTRVRRVLGAGEKGSGLRNAGVAFGLLCVATALGAGNALVGVVRAATAKPSPAMQMTSGEPVITITAPRPAPQAKPAPKAAPAEGQRPAQGAAPKTSYIEGLKAEGFENLSADELIALKVQGITPEYIHEIRAEGLKPSADELIGMKVQGITPAYVREIRALKLNADIDSLIGMKVQGITPEYVDQMRKLGFQPDSDQLIGMKVQGIGPDYVRELNELGIHADADELIGMKVQGINAEYVRSVRATGLAPDTDQWIALKVQGVTGEFIKSLQAAGFKPDVDDVVSAKVMGLTPQFIELAKSHGFKNLDLNKLIQLKQAGVLE